MLFEILKSISVEKHTKNMSKLEKISKNRDYLVDRKQFMEFFGENNHIRSKQHPPCTAHRNQEQDLNDDRPKGIFLNRNCHEVLEGFVFDKFDCTLTPFSYNLTDLECPEKAKEIAELLEKHKDDLISSQDTSENLLNLLKSHKF